MEITAQLQADEHKIYENREKNKEPEAYCDAQRWRFQYSGNVPHLIFALKIVCFSFLWLFWGAGIFTDITSELGNGNTGTALATLIATLSAVLLLASPLLSITTRKAGHCLNITGFVVCASVVLWVTGTLWGTTEMHISFWIGTFLYFMGAIGCDAVLHLYSLFSKHDGSEFNRIDGMVRFKRRFRTLFVAPFEEFDPVLRTIPTGHGSHDYVIWLYHRYTNKKLCLAVKVHALGLDKVNALAFWDSLQRYMDVTHPLPDLPVLEQSRHLDPVTAAHDARTGRPERRWRDQSIKSWKAAGEKRLTEQLKRYPWQQSPCIVRARISDTLNIEDYYRSLEAEGIDISPKADNFSFLYQMDQGAQ
ncbi:hypothetical protein V2K77_20645 [Pseudomonas alliivorans]|nr:hypothetical protein [Pseudomonas alliivorans]MEE4713816.1 hypothetical protein [Pseudomonas alliivorans]MEE4728159.1 hypothetical protein [Pseudomonas alliivorans]MEE4769532.1 hypothetical protein [Pseudomonas alliivorans]